MTLRKKIYNILEPSVSGSTAARVVEFFLIALVFLSILDLLLESVQDINREYETVFRYFEPVTVIVFTIEYILRLWTCVENPKYRSRVSGRMRYATTNMALIDFL